MEITKIGKLDFVILRSKGGGDNNNVRLPIKN